MRPARPRPSRVLAATAAVAVVAAVPACSGGTDTAAPKASASSSRSSSPASSGATTSAAPAQRTPLQLVAASSDTARKARTAKVTFTSTTTTRGRRVVVRGRGVVDNAASAARLTLTLPAGATGRTATLQSVVVGGRSYVHGVPGTRGKWVLVPSSGSSGSIGGSDDPTQTLGMLRQVSDGVREVGKEQVRGVATTKYAGRIDLRKAVARSAPGSSALRSQQTLRRLGVTTVPFTVDLDDQGRPARLTVTVALRAGGQRASSATTVDMYDWGTPVRITAPPASQVVRAPGSSSTATA